MRARFTTRLCILPAALIAGGMALSGCSGSPAASSAAGYAAPAAAGGGGQLKGAAPADAATGGKTAGSGTVATVDIGRPQGRIERHVDAAFRVPHGAFRKDFDDVIARGAAFGGFVVDSSTQADGDGRLASGSVTLRVPADKLSQLVSGLGGTEYEISGINYSSIDHTAQTVDLAAQLKAATGHRDALLQLLGKTQGIQDITTLETQIAQVQQQIDQVQGQSDAVAASVDLATARISLMERDLVAPPPSGSSPILDALRGGWSNSVTVISFALLALLSGLPLLLVTAAGLLVLRRLRPRGSTPPAPATSSSGAGGGAA